VDTLRLDFGSRARSFDVVERNGNVTPVCAAGVVEPALGWVSG